MMSAWLLHLAHGYFELPSTVTVFEKNTHGYGGFRIPGILSVDNNGTNGALFAFAEGRIGCGDFAGNHDVVYRNSTDAGKTWSNLRVLLAPELLYGPTQCPRVNATTASACQFWDPTPFYDHTTRTLFVMAAHSFTVNDRLHGSMDVWLLQSSDMGASWSAPRNITAQIWHPQWKTMTTGSGRLLVAGYVRPNGSGTERCATVFSDDHGESWNLAANSMQGLGLGTSECEAVVLPPQTLGHERLLMTERRNRGSGPPGRNRWSSYSEDDGLTWQGLHADKALVDPSCKGGVAAWPERQGGGGGGAGDAGGGGLLFTNVASATARVNVTLRVSLDGGKTWPHSRLLSAEGGYSDVQFLRYDHDGGSGRHASGSDLAVVLFEKATCTIDAAVVDLRTLVPSTQ